MAPGQSSTLQRILEADRGTFSAQLAEYLLTLDFTPQEKSRYRELSEKAQEGALSEDEKVELDDLLTANDVLMILQSKARLSLRQQTPAA
jgi:hypothetical protein